MIVLTKPELESLTGRVEVAALRAEVAELRERLRSVGVIYQERNPGGSKL